jgi:hypothetical protein
VPSTQLLLHTLDFRRESPPPLTSWPSHASLAQSDYGRFFGRDPHGSHVNEMTSRRRRAVSLTPTDPKELGRSMSPCKLLMRDGS